MMILLPKINEIIKYRRYTRFETPFPFRFNQRCITIVYLTIGSVVVLVSSQGRGCYQSGSR